MDYDSPRARRERQVKYEFAATPLGAAANEATRERRRADNWRDIAFMLALILALIALFQWL